MEVNDQRRGRRKDLVSHQNGGVSAPNIEDELDPWTAWAYKPRTITVLFIGACFLVWASGVLDPESSSDGDSIMCVKRGVWAMIAVYLAYSLLQAPSTGLIRPHPAIWCLVHGMAVIYLVALTFLLFQTIRNVCKTLFYFVKHLDEHKPAIDWIAATDLEDDSAVSTPEAYATAWKTLRMLCKTITKSFNTIPEFDKETPNPIVIFMPEGSKTHMGSTMRLGSRRTIFRLQTA